MLGLAIALLVLNIFLMLFIFFKLNKKFSNANLIREIKKDANKLMADIAFQTDKSVTVIEDKIREANFSIKELEKRILLADLEAEKKVHEAELLQELRNNAKREMISEASNLQTKNNLQNTPAKEKSANDTVKIYTKQVLSKSQNKVILPNESFHDQIIEMARNGFSTELIAEKVPLPIGEIELIISMDA